MVEFEIEFFLVEAFQLDMKHQHNCTHISEMQKATDKADISAVHFFLYFKFGANFGAPNLHLCYSKSFWHLCQIYEWDDFDENILTSF